MHTSTAGRIWTVITGVVGLFLIAGPLWTVVSTGDAVFHQHRALLILLIVSASLGIGLMALTVWRWRHPHQRTGTRRALVAVGSGVGIVLLVVVGGASVWLRPFPATGAALGAWGSDSAVRVTETADWYAFTPAEAATTGLVYSPGARVDARATAAVLRPLAESGYLVIVLKEPLGIALTDLDQASGAIAAYDDIEHWAVGGHSLGGVSAAMYADRHPDQVDGLLLHASYPMDDMSDADLAVTSVSGSEDGLSTPAKIADSRADLPGDTMFVEVEGAVHAFFADYGAQPGDGTPTVSRAEAQRQIIAAEEELMDRISG